MQAGSAGYWLRRQGDNGPQAGSGVLQPDVASSAPDEFAGDRQAEPRASRIARTRFVEARETVEDALAI